MAKKKNYSGIPIDNQNGDCYIQAYRYFNKNKYKNKDLRLVHGLVTGRGPIEGLIYNHAWCEDKSKCYDMTFPPQWQQLDKEIYYALGGVKKTFFYDSDEVANKSVEYGTYGPWEQELEDNPY